MASADGPPSALVNLPHVPTPTADRDDIRIERTSHGVAVHVRTDAGGWVRLVSDRDPIRDARAWVEETLGGRELPRHCIVIGPALGHVLDVLLESRSDLVLIAIEPFAELAAALGRKVARHAASERVVLLAGPTFEGASQAWRSLQGAETALVLVNPVLKRQCPSRLRESVALADRVKFDASANAGARAQFAAPYLLHTLENLPVLAGARDVARLFGRFGDAPIVVAAAGPSLDRSIEDLRAVRDRVLLIAVDTALRPLLYHGLEPDLVVGVDPGPENARHLRRLPPFDRAWFVAEPSLHPDCFAPFGVRLFAFRVADHAPWPWLRSAGLDCAVLRAWGSVLTCAFDLALRLGEGPIVFVGADLSFTGDQPYCRGTAFERDWADALGDTRDLEGLWRRLLASRELIDAEDVHHAGTRTTRAMVAFRDWLVEAAAAAKGRAIVNATGGGILSGGGIRQASLKSAVDGRGTVTLDVAAVAGQPDASRGERLARAVTGARAMLERRAPAEPVANWLTICPDRERLKAVLTSDAHGVASIETRRRKADAWVLSPALLAPERRRVLQALLAGEPVPAPLELGADDEQIAVWCERVHESLAADENDEYQLSIVELARRVRNAAIPGPPPPPAVIDLAARVEHSRRPTAAAPETPDNVRLWPGLLARCAPASTNPILARACDAISRWVPGNHASARSTEEASCRLVVDSPRGRSSSTWTVPFPALSGSLTGLAIDEGSGLATDGLVLQDRAADAFTVRLELRPASPRAVPFDARWPLDPHAFELPYTILRPAPDTLCFYVTQTSAGRARLVCSDRGVSMDVSADGTMREAHAWPAPVSGEIEWQDGAVAWTCGERSRLYRRTALGLAEEVELPARAFVAFATGEQVLFPSIEGGVWAWRPGGTCEQLIDTPPVNSIRRVEDGFELDPILVTEGPSFPRVRLDYTWAWNPAARTVTRRPSDAAGQSAPVATLEGWTAQVSPYADVVRVASPSGWSVRLHVAHALMAAFAGTSLVVTTGSGLVLLFEGLRDRLAERERIGRDSAR